MKSFKDMTKEEFPAMLTGAKKLPIKTGELVKTTLHEKADTHKEYFIPHSVLSVCESMDTEIADALRGIRDTMQSHIMEVLEKAKSTIEEKGESIGVTINPLPNPEEIYLSLDIPKMESYVKSAFKAFYTECHWMREMEMEVPVKVAGTVSGEKEFPLNF
jgi:hypothetical protein